MLLKHRKRKKHYSKAKPSAKNNKKFSRKFRLGFSSKAQAKRALMRQNKNRALRKGNLDE